MRLPDDNIVFEEELRIFRQHKKHKREEVFFAIVRLPARRESFHDIRGSRVLRLLASFRTPDCGRATRHPCLGPLLLLSHCRFVLNNLLFRGLVLQLISKRSRPNRIMSRLNATATRLGSHGTITSQFALAHFAHLTSNDLVAALLRPADPQGPVGNPA